VTLESQRGELQKDRAHAELVRCLRHADGCPPERLLSCQHGQHVGDELFGRGSAELSRQRRSVLSGSDPLGEPEGARELDGSVAVCGQDGFTVGRPVGAQQHPVELWGELHCGGTEAKLSSGRRHVGPRGRPDPGVFCQSSRAATGW
jgi:hypothetical protein